MVNTGSGPEERPNVALIPARGGSKRLPGKNLLDLGGRPMLVHTVSAALGSGVFSRVIFSSDDEAMRRAAGNAGAQVHDRPPHLATDSADLMGVVREIASAYSLGDVNLCLLMPNCPLRDARDVRESLVQFRSGGADFQISAYRYPMFNPFWSLEHRDGELKPVWPDLFSEGPKLHPDVMLPSGAIWWARLPRLLEVGDFYGPGLQAFLLPWHRAVDIDTAEELRLARMVAAALRAEPELFGE